MARPPAAAALHLVPPPAGGIYRLGRGDRPFAWSQGRTLDQTITETLGELDDEDVPILLAGNRYDDPDNAFLTTYGATEEYGCALEKLAAFRDKQKDYEQQVIEATSEEEPDPEFDLPLLRGIVPADFFDAPPGSADLRVVFGHIQLSQDALYVDVEDGRTNEALDRLVDRALLDSFGVDRVDRGLTLSRDRRITRPLAREIHRIARGSDEPPGAVGIRYTSVHDSQVECWAIWETAQRFIQSEPGPYPVDFTSTAIKRAAAHLHLELPPVQPSSPIPGIQQF